MTATRDYEDMHHLVDRLPPGQVRRLRTLVESDPELASFSEPSRESDETPKRTLSFIGLMSTGVGDLSERVDEVIHEELNRPA